MLDISTVFNLLSEKIENWLVEAIKMLPNLILSVIVFLFFILLAKNIKKLSSKLLDRVSQNASVNHLLSTMIFILVLGAGLFSCLELLQLEKALTSLLAGAGVIGLALGFAFQEIATNFISGVLIAFMKPYKVGDTITVGEFQGIVQEINLRVTKLITFQGLEVSVPNKQLFTSPLINFSTVNRRRIDLNFGVSYKTDLRKVAPLCRDCLDDLPGRDKASPINVLFNQFGDSSIDGVIQVWIMNESNLVVVDSQSEILMRIKEVFDKNQIEIPYPMRTVEFKTNKELYATI